MSVNRAFLLGNLGADPELRRTASDNAVCNFNIATTDRRKGSDGEWADHTEWHRIVTFGRTAENCAQYLGKGRQVFVEGRIQTRKWQDRDGNDRYTTEIIANTVQFIGSRDAGLRQNVQQVNTADAGAPFTEAAPVDNVSFDDDDIPF